MADEPACVCRRKRLLWHMPVAAFFLYGFNDTKLFLFGAEAIL